MANPYLLYWDENNAPDLDIIINILKRNYQDKDADGERLIDFAGFYALTNTFVKKLNDKGYAVKPNTEYIALMQVQPYKEINCIFGYNDIFEVKTKDGRLVSCGCGYLKKYTKEEIAEIEKMKAIPLDREFEYPELLEIEKSTKIIELESNKVLAKRTETRLNALQEIWKVIKDCKPYNAIGNDIITRIDYRHPEHSESIKVFYIPADNSMFGLPKIITDSDFALKEKLKAYENSYKDHTAADKFLRNYITKEITDCKEALKKYLDE